MQILTHSLTLPQADFRALFRLLGPSLGLWRAAEVAALREQDYPAPVLDLGCGDGLITSFVLPRVQIGLDPDAPALERAPAGLYERLVPVAMEQAGLEDSSLGSIISNSVLEHIERIDDALLAAARALRPGGRLVFTAPTEAFSGWLALPRKGYAQRRNDHFVHRNLWTLDEWERRLARAGLRITCARPYLRAGWVRAWDALELAQMARLGRTRLFGRAWRAMPPAFYDRLARRASRLDLSAPHPGGGRLIAAVKEE